MKDVPPKILKTFERMKKEESYHIELKFIGNNYYVYSATSEWDKSKKKVRKITEYIVHRSRWHIQEEEDEITYPGVQARGL